MSTISAQKMQSEPQSFRIGDKVSISGLTKTTKYNGKNGIIVSVPVSSGHEGRYGVQIEGVQKPLGLVSTKLTKAPVAQDKSTPPETKEITTPLFQVGDRVILRDLKAKKYNGQHATVVSPADETNEGRFGVRVDRPRGTIAIRPANMQKSTRQLKKERDNAHAAISLTREEYANADQMAAMRMLTNMVLSDEEKQITVFGRTIQPMPNFPLEVAQEGYPDGVDHKWARDYLTLAYERDSALPHTFEMYFKMEEFEPNSKDIMKRLCTNDPDKLRWYYSPQKPGSIYRSRTVHPYGLYVRHNYSNQAYRKERLVQGKTHIAIGFVDLGMIMSADLAPGAVPLRFIVVERSAFAVAKTHVIWEMLKLTPGSPDKRKEHERSVLQVWFSTSWSDTTLKAVKSALRALCSHDQTYHPEVRNILLHWWKAPSTSLAAARKSYATSRADSRSNISCLINKHDRVAMAKYELTGDFCVDDPTCGNITMFDCPDGTPPSCMDESVFAALNFKNIMDITNNRAAITIIDAAEQCAMNSIHRLASWCLSNKVTVDLRCSSFEDAVNQISAERPWTMSWSNVLDYVEYERFHDMARQCSIHGDTIHFGYSMNWVSIVWGTCLFDYVGKENARFRGMIIERANESAKQIYSFLGWDRRLRLPIPQNPLNTTSAVLETQHYKAWSKYFFDNARKNDRCCKVAILERAALVSPLAWTGGSTVAFTWTYDPDIRFNNVEEY